MNSVNGNRKDLAMSFWPKGMPSMTPQELEALFEVLRGLEIALSCSTHMDWHVYKGDEDLWNEISELYEKLSHFYDEERLDHE